MASNRLHREAESGIAPRLMVAALFAGCLPIATAGWLHAAGNASRSSPFASALDAAREAVGHAFSLPG